jgi:integrase
MTRRPQRPHLQKPVLPLTPAHKPLQAWVSVNRSVYATFRTWLHQNGCDPVTANRVGVAARLVFSLLEKPYRQLDPPVDLKRVRDYVCAQFRGVETRQAYFEGLAQFEAYLQERHVLERPPRRAAQRPPGVKPSLIRRPVQAFSQANQGFYAAFRDWLQRSSYSASALHLYGLAARLVFSVVDKPYWQMDPDADLALARDYVLTHYSRAGTCETYFKGIAKFEQFLRLKLQRPARPKTLHWERYVGALSAEVARAVKAYWQHCRRNWPPERQHELSSDMISTLTRPLRWLAAHAPFATVAEITPARWYAYLDARLADGIKPVTLNSELSCLLGWLRWLAEQGQPICARLLRMDRLEEGPRLPRDVPVPHLARLLQAVENAANLTHAGQRRLGQMDKAWILLMLHSGLRTGEIRRLKLSDLDWDHRRVRVEQSKGLKDRLVPLSQATVEALKAYLEVRGLAEALPEQVFIFQHAPLSESYCGQRLTAYYAPRTGVKITPHQLRHSCATLLLNAGAPVVTVQTILGHKHIDTTLGYARLYDGTVAADYYRAMAHVERRMALPEDAAGSPPSHAELLALVDSLHIGTLNDAQAETVYALRTGIMALAERDAEVRGLQLAQAAV